MPDLINWSAAFSVAFRDLVPFGLQLSAVAIAYHFARVAIEHQRRSPMHAIGWVVVVIIVLALLPFYSRPVGDFIDPIGDVTQYTRSLQEAATLAIQLLTLLSLATIAGIARGLRARREHGLQT